MCAITAVLRGLQSSGTLMAQEAGLDISALGPSARINRPASARIGAALALGLVARVVFALRTPFEYDDGAIFGLWAQTLRDHPLSEFYASAWTPDHLPGDLWFLKLLQVGYTAAGSSDFRSPAFQLLLKTVPITADLVVGILVFYLVKTWASEDSAVRTAQWYLLNPASIVLSGVWGQWDCLSAAFVLTGFLLVARGGRSWVWAAPFLVWAVLIKPPLVIFEIVILVWLVVTSRPRLGRARPPVLTMWAGVCFGGLGVATAIALLAPFRVGVAWTPRAGWSLLDRVHNAAQVYPVTTKAAPNIWMIVDRRVVGGADDVARWGPVTPWAAAALLFVLVTGAIVGTGWRAFAVGRQVEALVWSAAALTFGSCVVLTRVHERYYFLALLLLLLWASTRELDMISAGFFWSLSLMFIVDLSLWPDSIQHPGGFAHQPAFLVLLGLLHVGLFLALLASPWHARASGRLRAGAPSATSAARRTAPD